MRRDGARPRVLGGAKVLRRVTNARCRRLALVRADAVASMKSSMRSPDGLSTKSHISPCDCP